MRSPVGTASFAAATRQTGRLRMAANKTAAFLFITTSPFSQIFSRFATAAIFIWFSIIDFFDEINFKTFLPGDMKTASLIARNILPVISGRLIFVVEDI